jgi:hypothetical protein
MVFVSLPAYILLIFSTSFLSSYEWTFFCRLLLGFVFPVMWYYAAFLYFWKYYDKDPRERSGLGASAIAVSFVLKD